MLTQYPKQRGHIGFVQLVKPVETFTEKNKKQTNSDTVTVALKPNNDH